MPMKIQLDIPYKERNGKPLLLDMYTPENAPDTLPVVIYIHGGGWTRMDKSDTQADLQHYIRDELVQNGYAVLSINYSLINETVHFPAPIEDCKDAVRWARKNAGQYGFNAEKIGLWGASAGAHLAMLAAYSKPDEFLGAEELRAFSSQARFVIDIYGPVDLNLLYRTNFGAFQENLLRLFIKELVQRRSDDLFYFTGLTLGQDKQKIQELCGQYSPFSYISGNAPPTLILHGSKDRIVPLTQSKMLVKSLNASHIPNQLVVYKNVAHAFANMNQQNIASMLVRIREFTHANFQ